MEKSYFKFRNLIQFPEVIHGISNRHFGDMRFGNLDKKEIITNRQNYFDELGIEISDVVVAGLAHGNKVTQVGEEDRGSGSRDPRSAISFSDGMITNNRGIFLMVTGADCLPILIYDPVSRTIAILHAGWRGIIKGIVVSLIEKMKLLGVDPENLIFAIGPGICQKHFVVKYDVLKEFQDLYPEATLVRNHDGYVDLKKAIMLDLKKYHIESANVEIAPFCPVCDNGVYGSFRKEKESAPAFAVVIGLR